MPMPSFLTSMVMRATFAAVLLGPAANAAFAEVDASTTEAARMTGYHLVLIKTGPNSGKLSEADNSKAFAGHFANMQRLADARQLLSAGPFGEQRHDPLLRGLFVLATDKRAEAELWASTDPTTLAGVFTLEFHDLVTDAPLRAALERDLAKAAADKAAGRTPPPTEGMRGYVLLTAESAAQAEAELAALKNASGGVLLLARLDGTRSFAILDAENIAAAKQRFAKPLANIGTHTLDEWFASKQIEGLHD
jgi:uncharacterized protein YciI